MGRTTKLQEIRSKVNSVLQDYNYNEPGYEVNNYENVLKLAVAFDELLEAMIGEEV